MLTDLPRLDELVILILMLGFILILLVIIWLFGYGPVDYYRDPVFTVNKSGITLWNILIFLVLLWLISSLPGSLMWIGIIALLIWLAPTLGFFVVDFLASFIIIVFILSLLIYLVTGIPLG